MGEPTSQAQWFAEEAQDAPREWRGLVIREPYASLIVDGKKRWEIRGSATTVRGPVGIIAGGTGTVVGVARLIGSKPLTAEEYAAGWRDLGQSQPGSPSELPYAHTHAWQLSGAFRLSPPILYRHPSGAIKWVKLSPAVSAALSAALRQRQAAS